MLEKTKPWNARFQELWDQCPEDNSNIIASIEHERALSRFSKEFIKTAERIGKIIIDEVHLPVIQKNIQPAKMGGVAGGEKYLVEGIFFKFAIDAFGVYGGDDFAMKAAGHELNGLKAYREAAVPGLRFPFMVLISYKGYRLIATPLLPLTPGSLIYGSADAGQTVLHSDETMNNLMTQAAKKLNICEHGVGLGGSPGSPPQAVLAAPTDIEGHRGNDGRYYVLDTVRSLTVGFTLT